MLRSAASLSSLRGFVRSIGSVHGQRALELEETAECSVGSESVVKGALRKFDANVLTKTGEYRVIAECFKNTWAVQCSCGAERGCEHVVLAFCVLIGDSVSEVTGVTPQPKEARVEGTSVSPDSSVKTISGGAADGKGQSFEEQVALKLERPLLQEELRYARNVEGLYQSHAQSKSLTAEALMRLLGPKQLGHWELVELWPAPPKTAWEAWLYLACFLQRRGFPVPKFLAEITSASELDQIRGDWTKRQSLRCWDENLDRMLQDLENEHYRVEVSIRMMLCAQGARLQRKSPQGDSWEDFNEKEFSDFQHAFGEGRVGCSAGERALAESFLATGTMRNEVGFSREESRERLIRMLLNPAISHHIVSVEEMPFYNVEAPLAWRLSREEEDGVDGDYLLQLVKADGSKPEKPMLHCGGNLNIYVTSGTVYKTPPLLRMDPSEPLRIPPLGLQSERAIRLLSGLGLALPNEIEKRIVRVQPTVSVRCWLEIKGLEERICLEISANMGEYGEKSYSGRGWESFESPSDEDSAIVTTDTRLMRKIPGLLTSLGVRDYRDSSDCWVRVIGKRFPEEFTAWIEEMPAEINLLLEGDLDSLRSEAVKGTLQLSVEESTPDWFDVRVALSVSDTHLTSEEIQMLMEARGKFVRLNGKGWRRLDFEFEGDDEEMLNDLGINSIDFDGPPQRYHVLQLAHSSASRLLERDARAAVFKRAGELQVSVQPDIPTVVNAQMRPYQVEGFHFLCYLSTNRFGGILADDMGLGKTLQTLTWIQWLREREDFDGKCTLVVCPKSVVQNWVREAERFVPGLRATAWKGGDLPSLKKCIAQADLVVVNYAQLRILVHLLTAVSWHAIVLDEAQYIKNPASQTAVSACSLVGNYRLALSGTPIENRLMDLWSIMQFAMPGLLGLRSHFQKCFDSRTDGFARQRLSARVRPFILRRSKGEVAKDLPERIEEDLLVEMEGSQELLYRAELKRARQAILKIETSKELDKQRFNVLTSLLRLRQICCHPGLVSDDHGHSDSAKLDALTDLLEPLMEEGHKVLVFSQFVEMLERVEREVDARGWDSYMLTGETENRGELVDEFQAHEGSAVFLISLRAGGMGLNLTAASYVVLFDPWWNPAVENQAIDRTHRIGQTHQVIAYRLVVKNSIEEKIRHLQRTKSAMASDVLGEESFAKALTLNDFQFLLED